MRETTRTPSVPQRFEEVVRRRPDSVALSGGGVRMTYGVLNRAANRLARLIASYELPAESRVAFQLTRGPEQVLVMLAILKAGAAYLPLDPAYPVERRRFMLDDSDCPLVITGGTKLPESLGIGRVHVDLDRLGDHELPAHDRDLPRVDCRSLAYVIYTSGSTGQPKGVLVEHRGVVLLAQSLAGFYEGYGVERHYQFFSLAFDASVWEVFFSLLNGLELVVDPAGPGVLEPDELLDMLDAERIDSFMTTPSYVARATPRPRPGLKTITVCGEPCPLSLARSWALYHRFVNAYGPTENTVAATMCEVDGTEETMSIGWPLPHVEVLVLDEQGAPVQDHEVGELYLAGPAVARGYQRRPDLTKSAFVPDTQSRWAEPRMYRTGDLGLRRPDAQLEYVGRVDEQVKIRGFRVEPSEIEAHLRELPEIGDAAVVAVGEQADKFLAAFLQAQEEAEIDVDEVRRALQHRLPAHMIPLTFEALSELPLLPSGKTDRKSLRRRAATAQARPQKTESPGDAADLIASLWRQVLGRDAVDESDDFFDLGGQSVLASAVVAETRTELGVELPLRTLFEHPTLREYRAAVEKALGAQNVT